MICYTVRCEFTGDTGVAGEWVAWLKDKHWQDVLNAGAASAMLVRMDAANLVYEVRYVFPSREAFNTYEREHAPALRDEGLSRFPLERGLSYQRTVGDVVESMEM
jgi:hypothetical protein